MSVRSPEQLLVEPAHTEEGLHVRLRGALTLEAVKNRTDLPGDLLRTGSARIVLDLEEISDFDDYGIALLVDFLREGGGQGVEVDLVGVDAALECRMTLFRTPGLLDPDPATPPRAGLLEGLGARVLGLLGGYVESCLLVGRLVQQIFVSPFVEGRAFFGRILEQMSRTGLGGLPVVGLISFLVGLILAFQAAYQLRAFGALLFVADLVAVSMTREFGPLITAILVAGRSGSAMTAELATMQVGEEIDALSVIGIDPVRFLVAPRVVALMLSLPCLVIFADVLGVGAGVLVAVTGLGVGLAPYLDQTRQALQWSDLYSGLGKSLLFALLIGIIACRRGLAVRGGAESVGRATTRSVVVSILSIIVADGLFTAYVFYID